MLARLRTIEGQGKGDVLSLDGYDSITVGRSHDNTIQVNEPDVSRTHCRIERFGVVWRMVDAKSHNGTLLNDEAVDSAILKRGDSIRVGHTKFQVELLPGDAATEPGGDGAVDDTADASPVAIPSAPAPARAPSRAASRARPGRRPVWLTPLVLFVLSFLLTVGLGSAVLAMLRRGSPAPEQAAQEAADEEQESDLTESLPAEDAK